jgi:hypothetical protein
MEKCCFAGSVSCGDRRVVSALAGGCGSIAIEQAGQMMLPCLPTPRWVSCQRPGDSLGGKRPRGRVIEVYRMLTIIIVAVLSAAAGAVTTASLKWGRSALTIVGSAHQA